MIVCSYGV